jgi:uncharacterized protein
VSGNEQKQEMSVIEAGRRGGKECAARHGSAFYEAIGKKGGETTRARHGSEFYARQGKKGGTATAAKHGQDHFERIGRLGGQKVREMIERAKAEEAGEGEA